MEAIHSGRVRRAEIFDDLYLGLQAGGALRKQRRGEELTEQEREAIGRWQQMAVWRKASRSARSPSAPSGSGSRSAASCSAAAPARRSCSSEHLFDRRPGATLDSMADQLVVHGAREHNLKNITVALPRNKLICITGLSGSGKSSLAFDTIYAEGQRRYVESLSAYARQFLQMMEKPDVDSIEGLSPAISIDQKTTSRNPRSTVGTVTEIYDYLRLLYARVGRPHCPICGRPIAGQTLDQIVEQVLALPDGTRFTVNAPIVRDRKGEFRDVLEELRRDGFTRVKVDGEQRLLEEEIVLDKKFKHTIEVVVDRLVMKAGPAPAAHAVDRDRDVARRGPRPGRRRRRRDAPLQRELRLPRARRVAARARAADLLLQRPARRLPALHGPGVAARDRPRPARPRPEPLDRRGRARPVVARRAGLLRVGLPRDGRPVRDRSLDPRRELGREEQDRFLQGRAATGSS